MKKIEYFMLKSIILFTLFKIWLSMPDYKKPL